MLPSFGGGETISAGGLILPSASLEASPVERLPAVQEAGSGGVPSAASRGASLSTDLDAARILGDVVLAIQHTAQQADVVVDVLKSIHSVLVDQLETFQQYFAAEADRRQDDLLSRMKEGPDLAAPVADVGDRPDFDLGDLLQGLFGSVSLILAFIVATLRDKVMDILGRAALVFEPFARFGSTFLRAVGKFGKFLGAIVITFDAIEGFLTGLSEGGNFYTAVREAVLNVGRNLLALPGQLLALFFDAVGFDEAAAVVEKFNNELVDNITDGWRSIFDLFMSAVHWVIESVKGSAREFLSSLGADALANSSFLAPSADPTAGGGGQIASLNKDHVVGGIAKQAGPAVDTAITAAAGLTPFALQPRQSATEIVQGKVARAHASAVSGVEKSAPTVIVAPNNPTSINKSSTTVHSTPIVPLNTRSQEPVLSRLYDIIHAFGG